MQAGEAPQGGLLSGDGLIWNWRAAVRGQVLAPDRRRRPGDGGLPCPERVQPRSGLVWAGFLFPRGRTRLAPAGSGRPFKTRQEEAALGQFSSAESGRHGGSGWIDGAERSGILYPEQPAVELPTDRPQRADAADRPDDRWRLPDWYEERLETAGWSRRKPGLCCRAEPNVFPKPSGRRSRPGLIRLLLDQGEITRRKRLD